ncbi:MAG: AbrB/MazE/SpoVT family DNA-binding domain-containing protein [Prosthecobacter sp.]
MAHFDMTMTLTLDEAGRLALPQPVREKMHLRAGSKLRLDVMDDRMELTQEEPEARIEKRGKRRVVVGWEGYDAAQAVLEMRENQVARLDAPFEK